MTEEELLAYESTLLHEPEDRDEMSPEEWEYRINAHFEGRYGLSFGEVYSRATGCIRAHKLA